MHKYAPKINGTHKFSPSRNFFQSTPLCQSMSHNNTPIETRCKTSHYRLIGEKDRPYINILVVESTRSVKRLLFSVWLIKACRGKAGQLMDFHVYGGCSFYRSPACLALRQIRRRSQNTEELMTS